MVVCGSTPTGGWLVGVGKRAPHGFRCLLLVFPRGSLDRLKRVCITYSLYIELEKRESKTRQSRAGLGRVVRRGASRLSHHRHLHYHPSMMASALM